MTIHALRAGGSCIVAAGPLNLGIRTVEGSAAVELTARTADDQPIAMLALPNLRFAIPREPQQAFRLIARPSLGPTFPAEFRITLQINVDRGGFGDQVVCPEYDLASLADVELVSIVPAGQGSWEVSIPAHQQPAEKFDLSSCAEASRNVARIALGTARIVPELRRRLLVGIDASASMSQLAAEVAALLEIFSGVNSVVGSNPSLFISRMDASDRAQLVPYEPRTVLGDGRVSSGMRAAPFVTAAIAEGTRSRQALLIGILSDDPPPDLEKLEQSLVSARDAGVEVECVLVLLGSPLPVTARRHDAELSRDLFRLVNDGTLRVVWAPASGPTVAPTVSALEHDPSLRELVHGLCSGLAGAPIGAEVSPQ